MYILQNGKMYIESGHNKIIGVEIHPDKIITIKGTEIKLEGEYEVLTAFEVRCRYNLDAGDSYVFPVEKKKEVVDNEPVINTKKPVRKSTRK